MTHPTNINLEKGEITMEKYEPLEMEVIEFEVEDIITQSGDDPYTNMGGLYGVS